MVKVKDENLWREEYDILCKLPKELEQEGNFPNYMLYSIKNECNTLRKFLLSKPFPHRFTPEEIQQLESKVRALGYSSNRGVHDWFNKRKIEKKKEFHKTYTRRLPKRNKQAEERGCVKTFYRNKGICLDDSKIKSGGDANGIDVTVEESSRETHFQVTYLLPKDVGQLSKGDFILHDVSNRLKEIEDSIGKILKHKENKSRPDVILLLDACTPILIEELEDLNRIVDRLPSKSSFDEIYIVTPKDNIPVRKVP